MSLLLVEMSMPLCATDVIKTNAVLIATVFCVGSIDTDPVIAAIGIACNENIMFPSMQLLALLQMLPCN